MYDISPEHVSLRTLPSCSFECISKLLNPMMSTQAKEKTVVSDRHYQKEKLEKKMDELCKGEWTISVKHDSKIICMRYLLMTWRHLALKGDRRVHNYPPDQEERWHSNELGRMCRPPPSFNVKLLIISNRLSFGSLRKSPRPSKGRKMSVILFYISKGE